MNCVDIYLDAETSAAQCWDRWPGHRLQTFIAVSHKPAQLVTTRRHPIQYAINTVLFSPTPLASSTDIVQMCRSSKQQLKGGVATHDGQSVCQIAGHCAAVTRPSRVTRSPASSRHVTHSAAAGKWRLMFILHPHLGPPLLPAGALHNRRPGGGQEAARSC